VSSHASYPLSPDPETAAQRRHWDGVAPRWWAFREVMETASRPVSERLVEWAGVGEGARVVDVASGFGEPALSAARRAGRTGLVLATDTSGAMLAMAAVRAREAGLSRLFRVRMDATRPALPQGAFDAVLCRFGLMALPDLEAGLATLRGLLRPGGRMAAAVWGPPERVPSIALPLTVMRKAAGLPAPQAGEKGPFRLGVPGRVADAFRAAGFRAVEEGEVAVAYRFPSADDFTRFCRGTSSPVAALLREAALDEEASWAAVTRAAGERAGADGAVVFENVALCVAGTA
jgi:ubiquinone/menaquinone biosynthesis C-methylase UbiE